MGVRAAAAAPNVEVGPASWTDANEGTVIIGGGSSGKTHLAKQLATHHELPLTHLDAVYHACTRCPLLTINPKMLARC